MTNSYSVTFRISAGWIGIVYSEKGLKRLVLPCVSREEVLNEIGESHFSVDNASSVIFNDLQERLQRYFDGELVNFNDRLDLSYASKFRQKVWNKTRSIPYGQTRSYRWVAEHIGQARAVRAVGQALGSNPLPIVVPCHRVISSDGKLGGFSGGLDMKKLLLKLEKTHTSS